MMNETTINKLIQMRLTAMADALRMQQSDRSFTQMSFEERLGLLVDVEYSTRRSNRLNRLIQQAHFDNPMASIADINYTSGRILDKDLIHRLASCEYILDKHNVMILGSTGSGKSFLACSLGLEACRQFYTVRYVRLPELLTELAIARMENKQDKVFNKFSKPQLLIIDEWMLMQLTGVEAEDVFELIHKRHRKASTIVCSQFPPTGWHARIGHSHLADGILDRLVHDAYEIKIKYKEGEDRSMREFYGLKK